MSIEETPLCVYRGNSTGCAMSVPLREGTRQALVPLDPNSSAVAAANISQARKRNRARRMSIAREGENNEQRDARRKAIRDRMANLRARRRVEQQQAREAERLAEVQVREYDLANFDPSRPLHSLKWARDEMHDKFQLVLRELVQRCCIVCHERWMSSETCADPQAYT